MIGQQIGVIGPGIVNWGVTHAIHSGSLRQDELVLSETKEGKLTCNLVINSGHLNQCADIIQILQRFDGLQELSGLIRIQDSLNAVIKFFC